MVRNEYKINFKLGSRALSIYLFNKGRISTRHPGFIECARAATKFCTKSTYEGNYNSLGFAGCGEYVYPHGVKYEGGFKDGMFHGRGTLSYPVGQTIDGVWKHGKLISYLFRSYDGITHSTNWKYCHQPDRRFQAEKVMGLRAPGEEFLTNRQPTKPLKPDWYDTVDGYFCGQEKCIYKDEHIYIRRGNKVYHCRQAPDVLRVCTKREEQLIRANYRNGADDPMGYCPVLYEIWTTGQASETESIIRKLRKAGSSNEIRLVSNSVISSSESSTSDSLT